MFSTIAVILAIGCLGLPAADDDIERAKAALEKLAARHAKLSTMSGSFVQEIRTPLSRKPITSEGTLTFQRKPACAVFELSKPRRSIVRFDERSYRVYRPEEKRAETFIFKANDLASAFVQVFAPKAKEMEKIFRVASSRSVPGNAAAKNEADKLPALEIVLQPLDKKFENHFVELRLVIEPTLGGLRQIAYTNAQGDTVAILIRDLKIDPKVDPKLFDPALPEGTTTKVHRL